MKHEYNVQTPELAAKFEAMNTANEVLAKVAKKLGVRAVRSPEYKAAMVAYRAYWDAVDAKPKG
jgi:hypothetical protein